MPSGPLPVAVSNSLFVALSCPDERLNSSLFSPHQNSLSLLFPLSAFHSSFLKLSLPAEKSLPKADPPFKTNCSPSLFSTEVSSLFVMEWL